MIFAVEFVYDDSIVSLGASPLATSLFFPPEKLIGTFNMLLLRRLSTMCRKFDVWDEIPDALGPDDTPDKFVSALFTCVV